MTQTTFNGRALLVGVGGDLPVTLQDAAALRDVLVAPDRAAYPPEQVELLVEAQAHRHAILTGLDRLVEWAARHPEATVIFYYAGHGGRIERSAASISPPVGEEGELDRRALARLRQVFVERFDEGELRTLCYDAGMDYDELPGLGLGDKARELVAYLERRREFSALFQVGRMQRPDIPWDDMLPRPVKAAAASSPTRPSPRYLLLPHGYDPARPAETGISGLELAQRIERIRSRKLVIFLDCCHAAGVPALKEAKEADATFVKSPLPPELLEALAGESGRVAVASSQEGEYSYTGPTHSVFTACLLEALTGQGTVEPDGLVRILDVLAYLFKHVPERAPGPQHPLVKKALDLGENFPLCYYAGGTQGQPDPGASGLTSGQRRRLKLKLEGLEAEWELRSAKLKQLRSALAIEAGAATKFQLEQQLLEEEGQLARLGEEMDELEQALEGGS